VKLIDLGPRSLLDARRHSPRQILLAQVVGSRSSIIITIAIGRPAWSPTYRVWTYERSVAKMASHAIFQYNVLAIDDTHNSWTNMIVKMIILRLLGSSDDKEKIGVARPKGPPLRGFRYRASVHCASFIPETMSSAQEKFLQHRLNRRSKIGHRCIGRPMFQRRCKSRKSQVFSTG